MESYMEITNQITGYILALKSLNIVSENLADKMFKHINTIEDYADDSLTLPELSLADRENYYNIALQEIFTLLHTLVKAREELPKPAFEWLADHTKELMEEISTCFICEYGDNLKTLY